MNESSRFLIEYGYLATFASVLVCQLGLPIPAELVLLATGALARTGELSFLGLFALSLLATLGAQTFLYELGRKAGARILAVVCRVSLEPDVCVSKTSGMFERLGPKAIIAAYFIPGLNIIAPPLAGTLRMPRLRFHAFNLAGALLWCGGFLFLGFVFSQQTEAVISFAERVGGGVLEVAVLLVIALVSWRLFQRHRVLRELRMARIEPGELKRLIDDGAGVFIVDLRHSIEADGDPDTIPGAFRLLPEEVERRHHEIPRDRDIILFCT